MSDVTGRAKFRTDWRLAWYCCLIWLLLAIVSNLVVFPWFYLALPAVVFFVSILYFGRRGAKIPADLMIFAQSLRVGVVWFIAVLVLDIVAFVGFDLGNLYLYLVDSRNFFKLPIIILVPVFYGLFMEKHYESKKAVGFESSPFALKDL